MIAGCIISQSSIETGVVIFDSRRPQVFIASFTFLHGIFGHRSSHRVYCLPGGDNIFNGQKGLGSRTPGLCPIECTDFFALFNDGELNEDPERWILNLLLHRYRVVVENSIAQIKLWRIVKDPYKGNIEDQPFLFLVASRLTAFIMRKRNAYPRGENFFKGELEEWEVDLKDYLWLETMNNMALD